MEKKPKYCLKCKKLQATILIATSAFCKDCFLEHCKGKLHSTIRNKVKIWKDDSCVAFVNAGINSLGLLNILSKCNELKVKGNLIFPFSVAHIDESSIFPWGSEAKEKVIKECEKHGYDYFIAPLELLFESDVIPFPKEICDTEIITLKRAPKKEKKKVEVKKFEAKSLFPKNTIINASASSTENIKKLFGLIPESLKQEFAQYMRKWLMLSLGLKYHPTRILLASNADSMASDICSLIASGRGINIASDSGYADGKYGQGMMFVNVMRDFLDKELKYYSYVEGVRAISKPSGAFDGVIKSFLNSLQEQHPSSVFSITQTTLKLLNPKAQMRCPFCSFCLGLIDHSALFKETPKDLPEKCTQNLCYGCLNILGSKLKNGAAIVGELPKLIQVEIFKENEKLE